jgi:hypothetical protein
MDPEIEKDITEANRLAENILKKYSKLFALIIFFLITIACIVFIIYVWNINSTYAEIIKNPCDAMTKYCIGNYYWGSG